MEIIMLAAIAILQAVFYQMLLENYDRDQAGRSRIYTGILICIVIMMMLSGLNN